jgi:hypothetical protein
LLSERPQPESRYRSVFAILGALTAKVALGVQPFNGRPFTTAMAATWPIKWCGL